MTKSPVSRAGSALPNDTQINRRSFLIGTGAIGGASAVPSFATANHAADTPVMKKFRELKVLIDRYNDPNSTASQEMDDITFAKISNLEADMMNTPSQTPADVAAKMLAESHFGTDTCRDYETCPAWIEARKLVGIEN